MSIFRTTNPGQRAAVDRGRTPVRRAAVVAAATLVGSAALAPAAQAAEETLGQAGWTNHYGCGSRATLLWTASSGAPLTPSRPGVVTSWTSPVAAGPGSTRALSVWRPAPGGYTLVWQSDFEPVSPAAHPVEHGPIMAPGDLIGVTSHPAPGWGDCAFGVAPGNRAVVLPDGLAVGATSPAYDVLEDWYPLAEVRIESVDDTGPVVAARVDPASPGVDGWYTGSPTVSFDVSDPESEISAREGCDPTILDHDTTGTAFTCTATSEGGTTTRTVELKRDATAPTASFEDGPADGGEYVFGHVPTPGSCTAVDSVSGPDSCVISGYSAAVGTHTLVATAQDRAGNVSTTTRTYAVLPWTTSGFRSPVETGTRSNIVKAGSTVPLKLTFLDGDVPVTDPAQVIVTATPVACAGDPAPAASGSAGTVTGPRGDSTADQLVYQWRSPRSPGACFVVTATGADGTATTAQFALR